MNRSEFLAVIMSAARAFDLSPEGAAAHAANESNYGESLLAAQYHNLWGVKATGSRTPYWNGSSVSLPTWEEVNGEVVRTSAAFRVYEDWPHAVGDYADLIERLYPYAAAHPGNPVAFLAGLFAFERRWATDSMALAKALRILDEHGLLSRGYEQLGEHAIIVDNTPSLAGAWVTALAALQSRPAVHAGPFAVTRTRRPDGSYKLDTRAV